MAKSTGAKYLAQTLQSYGVTHVFFVPTILSQTLTEMELLGTGIHRIMTHGEKAAAYMADGYARASRRPGICMAQTVGAANLAAGLRDPYLACTPMVAFTGGPYPRTSGRHTYQEIRDLPLFAPVTKYSTRVDDVTRLPDSLRQAFRVATTGTPGPTHIELQGHLGELELEEADLSPIAEQQFVATPAFRPEADDISVREVLRLLVKADRPVIVAGGGVRTSEAGPEVLELAERLRVPVATSLNAKAVVPGDHPLSVGVVGDYSRTSANRTVLESDLVFFIGSHTGSQVTSSWRVPPPGRSVIQLDIEPTELGRHYENVASLLGDAKATLRKLIAFAKGSSGKMHEEWVQRARALVEQWREQYADPMSSDAVPIRPERICKELSHHLPSDTLLVADTGHAGMWTGGMIDLKAGMDYVRAAGSLGWGLPAALGAKLARPDRPVILWSGDGGLWYHLSELETAVRWNINAVILVNNNHSLNQEIQIYRQTYGPAFNDRTHHGDLWHFRDTNFAAVAESFGAVGIRVTRPGELDAALDRAFQQSAPVVVDVATEITALAPLAVVAGE